MEPRFCIQCKEEIPIGRLEALPSTEVCVRCSTMKGYTEETPGILDGADPVDLVAMLNKE